MAEFTAAVYQNEFLPDGGTDVHAIVTIRCTGAGAAGRTGSGDAGEIVIVDTSGSMGRGEHERRQAGGDGRPRPDPRRHLVRCHRRQPQGLPGLPDGADRCRHGADGRPDPGRGATRDQLLPLPTAAPRWGPGCSWPAAVRLDRPARPEARDPAHRRREPQRDHRPARPGDRQRSPGDFQCDCPRRRRRLEGAPRCARSPRRCWAPSTSSRDPRQMDAVFAELMRSSMARGVAERASCGSGPPRARRCCSSARSPPRSRTSPAGARR